MKRFLRLGSVLVLFAICLGCGDVFRPIIIPNPQQFPNPRAAHTVVTISDNGSVVDGSAMVIDVSGDADVSQKNVGLRPVHAVQQSANTVLVVNQSVTGTAQDSLTRLNFSGTVIGSISTITLPAGSAPNFVATTEANRAYVSLPQYVDPTTGSGVPSIAVVNTTQNGSVATIPVGNNPDAIAETPNGQKLYVANKGDSTISAFNTSDDSAREITGSFNAPLWLVARSDSQRLYVLNSNGVVSTLDTTLTPGPDAVISSISVPVAIYMVYDTILNRLYIPGAGQLAVLDVSQSIPNTLATIAISTVPASSRGAGDPCAGTTAGPLSVLAAAALPDGSRAYVGSFYLDNLGNVCPQVTVITTSNNTFKTSIAVPGFPAYSFCADPTQTRFRLNMAAGGDSSRVYLASCDGGNVNIIDTSTDTYILNTPAPYSVRPPVSGGTLNPPQNPVFMIAGP
jgi:DNA-binding beta-propeller fold protein YncE